MVSGFAARTHGDSTNPAEQRRRDLLNRGEPSKPALWNYPCVRPLRLDPVPVALRVSADLAAELGYGLAWRTAEPQEGTKLKGVLVKHHPDNAAARLVLEVAIDRDLIGLATPVGALQLDRAPDPLVAEHELVAVSVDLRAQHLDIVHPHAPKRPQKVAKKDVLQNLFAPARMGGMDRINGAGDLLRVRLSGHLSGPGRQD